MLTSLLKASTHWQKKSSFLLCFTLRLFTRRGLPKQDGVCKGCLITWDRDTAVHKRGTSEESGPPNGGWAVSTSLIQSLSQYAIGSLQFFCVIVHAFLPSETFWYPYHMQRPLEQGVIMGHTRRGSLANRHTHSNMPNTYARTLKTMFTDYYKGDLPKPSARSDFLNLVSL